MDRSHVSNSGARSRTVVVGAGVACLVGLGLLGHFALGSVEGQTGNGTTPAFLSEHFKPLVNIHDPKVIAAGEQTFASTCAYCHGFEGSGGRGPRLKGRKGLTLTYLYLTISNGRVVGGQSMPPWKWSFSKHKIWELVAYVHSLAGKSKPGAK